MKKLQTFIIVSVVLVTGFALFAVAFAEGDQGFSGRGFSKHREHRGSVLALLSRYQFKNLAAHSLAEMSGHSAETINQKFENQRPHVVMQELNIDRETFRTVMQEKIKGLVKQATENGSITPVQEREILAKIEEKDQRRVLLNQLIEKGVSDGTITKEQALMIQRKPK